MGILFVERLTTRSVALLLLSKMAYYRGDLLKIDCDRHDIAFHCNIQIKEISCSRLYCDCQQWLGVTVPSNIPLIFFLLPG